jgi:hypothetical protein
VGGRRRGGSSAPAGSVAGADSYAMGTLPSNERVSVTPNPLRATCRRDDAVRSRRGRASPDAAPRCRLSHACNHNLRLLRLTATARLEHEPFMAPGGDRDGGAVPEPGDAGRRHLAAADASHDLRPLTPTSSSFAIREHIPHD